MFYKIHVGEIDVISISDGILSGDINAVQGINTDEAKLLLNNSLYKGDIQCSSNNFIIKSAGQLALIDTGAGPHIVPTAGKLIENMSAAGLFPVDINVILFTHIHPDHISGLLDADGKKVFPHAIIKMHQYEFDFWLSQDPLSKKISHVKHEAEHVIKFLTPYLDQIECFNEGEVFPGVFAVPLYGHTPGHTGYQIKSEKNELLIWGDIIHWPYVQFNKPHAAMIYDVNPEEAIKTRIYLLNTVANTDILIAGMHLYFPGIIRVKKTDQNFEMIPIPWGHRIF